MDCQEWQLTMTLCLFSARRRKSSSSFRNVVPAGVPTSTTPALSSYHTPSTMRAMGLRGREVDKKHAAPVERDTCPQCGGPRASSLVALLSSTFARSTWRDRCGGIDCLAAAVLRSRVLRNSLQVEDKQVLQLKHSYRRWREQRVA